MKPGIDGAVGGVFYGIIIKMYFKPKEHEPSHIHAL